MHAAWRGPARRVMLCTMTTRRISHVLAPAAAALALGAVLAACGAAAPAARAAHITVTGVLEVTDASPAGDTAGCDYAADDGYSDISQGAQVTVSVAGKVIAVGQLQAGSDATDSGTCSFVFNVNGVPAGRRLYGVQVSHRGTLYYSAAQLRKGLQMTLGG